MKRFKLISAMALALILSLALAATAAAAPNQSANTGPNDLNAELCGDAVCLSWTPASTEFSFQRVMYWQGTSIYDRSDGVRDQIGAQDTSARIPLESLDLAPTTNAGDTAAYSFQVVGVTRSDQDHITRIYSHHVTLELPRPYMSPGPTNLNVDLCGDALCISWTPGAGDLTFQEIRYWAAGDPANLSARGSQLVLPHVSETRIATIHLNRPEGHSGVASYTFQAVGITGDFGNFGHLGYSNEVDIEIPAHLMERPDHNDKKGGKHANKKHGK